MNQSHNNENKPNSDRTSGGADRFPDKGILTASTETGGIVKRGLSRWPLRIACIVSLSVCVLLEGCVGATRLPVRTGGPGGAAIAKEEIDLNFLKVGMTHREEVANRLAPIDTSFSNPSLFWGRWSESRWGYWWFVAFPCNTNCAAGDAKRLWHVQNLLVTFDGSGVVTGRDLITNDEALWPALHLNMLQTPPPPLDLSQPLRIALSGDELKAILLSKTSMQFEGSGQEKPSLQISPLKLTRFSHRATRDKKSLSRATCHALEFSERTVYGKKINFCADAAAVGTLFQYLQEAGPPSMRWK